MVYFIRFYSLCWQLANNSAVNEDTQRE